MLQSMESKELAMTQRLKNNNFISKPICNYIKKKNVFQLHFVQLSIKLLVMTCKHKCYITAWDFWKVSFKIRVIEGEKDVLLLC